MTQKESQELTDEKIHWDVKQDLIDQARENEDEDTDPEEKEYSPEDHD